MLALLFGLTAALAWSIHDFLVRQLAPGAAVEPLALTVLTAGTLFLAPVALMASGWGAMTAVALLWATAAGVAYVAGAVGLYYAFGMAPVRIVSPVIGSFPMLSLFFAALEGRGIAAVEWLASAAIVAGIAVVAISGKQDPQGETRLGPALVWGVISAAGFAASFSLGQIAVREGAALPAAFVTRIAAVALLAIMTMGLRRPLSGLRTNWRMLVGMGALDGLALTMVITAALLPHAEYAAVSSSLFGVLTVLLAWQFLNEQVLTAQWAGIMTAFAGIAVLAARGV